MKKHSLLWLLMILLISCGKKESKFKKQEIDVIESETADESADSVDIIAFSKTLNQLKTKPGTVLQTGFPAHRLTPVYLAREIKDKRFYEKEDTIKKYDFSLGETDYNTYDYVMPGFDLLKGYYMLNISHFNLNTQQQNWMFAKPVLINNI